MYILSQNFKEVLKNRLESKIKLVTNTFVDDLIKSFSGYNEEKNYINLISKTTCVSNKIFFSEYILRKKTTKCAYFMPLFSIIYFLKTYTKFRNFFSGLPCFYGYII